MREVRARTSSGVALVQHDASAAQSTDNACNRDPLARPVDGLWPSTLLGYFGGTVFQQSFWLPLLVSLLVASVLSAAAVIARRRDLLGPAPDELDGDVDDSDLEEEAREEHAVAG